MRYKVLFFALIIPIICFAHTTKIDSLISEMNLAEGTEKIDLLLAIAHQIQFSSVDKAKKYLEEVLILSQEMNYEEGLSSYWNVKGQLAYRQGDFSEAEEYYLKAEAIFEQLEYEKGLSKIYNNLALLKTATGDLDEAENFHMKSLTIKTELDDQNGISYTLSNIGLIRWNQHKYSEAMDYFMQSLEIQEKVGDLNMVASTNNNMGLAYLQLNNYEKALEHHLKALELGKELDNQLNVASSYNNIGIVYSKMGLTEDAIYNHKQALESFLLQGDKPNIAATYNNLGLAYHNLQNYEKALEYQQQALAIRREINDASGITHSLSNLASIYEDQSEFDKALEYYAECLQKSEKEKNQWQITAQHNNLGRIYLKMQKTALAEFHLLKSNELASNDSYDDSRANNLLLLSNLYELKNNYQKAYDFLKQHITIKDTLTARKNLEKANEIKIKHDIERHQEENILLKKDLALYDLRVRNLILTVVAVLIFLAFIIILFVSRIKINRRLRILNKQLRIAKNKAESHEEDLSLINKMLRHDLTNILAVIRSAFNLYKQNKDMELLKQAEEKCSNGIAMIKNLQNMEMQKVKDTPLKLMDLKKIIKNYEKSFSKLVINNRKSIMIKADEAINSVFDNLLDNARKHGEATEIELEVNSIDKFWEIRIADNGKGIPDQIKDKIFEENYSYGSKANSGQGLYLVRKNIRRFGGSVHVEDNSQKGCVFVINLHKAEF